MPQRNSEEMMQRFRYCHNLMRRRYHQKVHEQIGTRHGRGKVLSVLRDQDGIGQKELSEVLQIRPASASELLGKMEKIGWVQRRVNEHDRRKINVFLTEKGKGVSQQMIQARKDMADGMFGALSAEEFSQFQALLDKLIAELESTDRCGKKAAPQKEI